MQGGILEFTDRPRFFWGLVPGPGSELHRESERWIPRYGGIGFSTVNAATPPALGTEACPFGDAPIMEDKKWQRQAPATRLQDRAPARSGRRPHPRVRSRGIDRGDASRKGSAGAWWGRRSSRSSTCFSTRFRCGSTGNCGPDFVRPPRARFARLAPLVLLKPLPGSCSGQPAHLDLPGLTGRGLLTRVPASRRAEASAVRYQSPSLPEAAG